MSFVPKTFERPELAYEVNFLGSIEFLAAVRDVAPRARVVLVTSGEVYGWIDSARDLPLVESQPLRPLSPYSVARRRRISPASSSSGPILSMSSARDRSITRDPARRPSSSAPSSPERWRPPSPDRGPKRLQVGNLEVERDFSDVRDVVRGYVSLFEKGNAGEAYNLGSGRATRLRAVLDELRAQCRVPVEVDVDPRKLRPREVTRVVGSIDKIGRDTGWRPEIPLRQTLADLLNDWRQELNR